MVAEYAEDNDSLEEEEDTDGLLIYSFPVDKTYAWVGIPCCCSVRSLYLDTRYLDIIFICLEKAAQSDATSSVSGPSQTLLF